MAETPTICVVGSGNMGRAIGISLAKAQCSVFFAGRKPSEAPKAAAELARKYSSEVQYGTISNGIKFGDVVVWTTRETDVTKVIDETGIDNLKKKSFMVVLDVNNWNFDEVIKTGIGASLDKESRGEQLQKSFNGHVAHMCVYKAFTTVPMEIFALEEDARRKLKVQAFLASLNDTDPGALHRAKAVVGTLGFEPVDLGTGPQAVRMAEMMGDVMRFCLSRGAGNGAWSHLSISGVEPASIDSIGGRVAGYK